IAAELTELKEIEELQELGLEVEITDTISVRSQAGNANAARARSVLARLPGSDSTGVVLLGGHLDTVHTTTGASDCGAAAVSVLETARALAAGPSLKNDIIFLIEDGEETSRSGSNSFATQHRWAQDVRVAFNLEAMGTGGSSLLYVTGQENQWIIDEALQVMPDPVAYSFANDLIWSTGTGGSDLDQFLTVAETGLGLVYLDNVSAYHSMADSIENLDPSSLYHHGNTMLSLARHFGNLDLAQDLTRGNAVYFNLLSRFVVHYPARAGVMIAVIAAAALAAVLAIGFRSRRLEWKGILLGAAVFLPFAIAATALSGLLWYLLRVIDPRLQVFLIGVSYDRPLYSLAFALFAAALVTAGYALFKKRRPVELGLGAALWFAFLSLVSAFALPGSSYIFSFSLLFSLPAFAATLYSDRIKTPLRIGLYCLSSFLVILIYGPFVDFLGIFSGRAELLMGLPVIAMFPAFAVSLIAPLLQPLFQEAGVLAGVLAGVKAGLQRRWTVPVLLASGTLFILTVVSISADFSPERPKPNMVAYILNADADADADKTYWVTGSVNVGGRRTSLMDEWTAQFFSEGYEEGLYSPWGGFMPDTVPAYTAPAPAPEPASALQLPRAILLADSTDRQGRRHMHIRLHSPDKAATMLALVKTDEQIIGASLAGHKIQGPAPESPLSALNLGIYGSTAGEGVELNIILASPAPLEIYLEDHRYSLPQIEGFEVTPRPDWMMPSPTFVSDATLARHTIVIE
ncbi:MAG: M28 family peptidase, partial [Spirochaetia bacterium]